MGDGNRAALAASAGTARGRGGCTAGALCEPFVVLPPSPLSHLAHAHTSHGTLLVVGDGTGPPRELDAEELAFLRDVEAAEDAKERAEEREVQRALHEFKVGHDCCI